VDYAGDGVPVVNRSTGEIVYAQVFVAVMGASNYLYVLRRRDQSIVGVGYAA
jgi:transposase